MTRSNSTFSLSSLRSRARSACSVSDCELTETYSPAAIDIAPATSPATSVIRISLGLAEAAATPTMRLAVETIHHWRTAARSHPNPIHEVAFWVHVKSAHRALNDKKVSLATQFTHCANAHINASQVAEIHSGSNDAMRI